MKSQYDKLKNGLTIHSIVAGNENLPPLVLIHGYPTNALLWRHCLPRLAKHFRIYAPDLPGYGQSDKDLDADYDLNYYVEFMLDYYRVMGLEKAHLAVHDIGGQVGLGFASQYPEKLDKFIVMNTAPYKEWSPKLEKIMAICRSPFWSRIMLFKFIFYYATFRDKDVVYQPDSITAEAARLYHQPWVENKISRKAFSKVLCASAEEFTVQPETNLRKITAPTLILWAENDAAMGTDAAIRLKADLPNSKLDFVSDCGHFLPEEKPEVVTEQMLGFFLNNP